MKPLKIKYKNWRGEESEREIIPESIYYGANKFHPQAGWLIAGVDVESGKNKTFSMRDMVILDD